MSKILLVVLLVVRSENMSHRLEKMRTVVALWASKLNVDRVVVVEAAVEDDIVDL